MMFARTEGMLELKLPLPPPKKLAAASARVLIETPTTQAAAASEAPAGTLANQADATQRASPLTMAAADTTEAVSSPAARSPDEEATHSSGEGSNLEYAEQGSDNACIQEDPELDTSVNSSESGRHIGVDAFDTEGFIDAMRTEVLFGPLATDDINVSSEPFPDDGESDDEDDAVAPPSAVCVEYESEIESDTEFEDESELFRQDDDAMRQLGLSGWKLYDENHSGNKSVCYRIVVFELTYSGWH